VREKKRRTLAALCMIAAQDYQAKLLRGSGVHGVEKIAKLLKVPASNYHRDYGPWIERMELIMEGWDSHGRQAVGTLVSDERKKLEKCH
jgi:imidazole glycerol phosphate synthase subunit HisF